MRTRRDEADLNPFHLYRDDIGKIVCPHCLRKYHVDDWTSEYGDPIEGEYVIACPDCNQLFDLTVEHRGWIYSVKKGEDNG